MRGFQAFKSGPQFTNYAEANALLTRNHLEPYVVWSALGGWAAQRTFANPDSLE